MTTLGRWTFIPVVTVAISVAGCGSDDKTADPSSSIAATVPTAEPSSSSAATVPAADPTSSTAATVITGETTATTANSGQVVIEVTAGVDSGEDRIEDVPLGSTVKLTVINPDKDDEFHVHGYDLGDGVEVPKGEPETFTFTADKAGEFEVESHTTEVVLLILRVS